MLRHRPKWWGGDYENYNKIMHSALPLNFKAIGLSPICVISYCYLPTAQSCEKYTKSMTAVIIRRKMPSTDDVL